MERRLLAELQSSSSSDDQLKELYGRVSDLRAHVILNYLAVLKITKKHDKQSPNNPIREQALSRRRWPLHACTYPVCPQPACACAQLRLASRDQLGSP